MEQNMEIGSMGKKTVLFDVGNVILYFSHEQMCKQIADYCKTDPQEIKQLIFHNHWGKNYESGCIDGHRIFEEFRRLFGESISYPGLMHAMSDIFALNDSIVPVIKKLKQNGVQLITLSNTCQAHYDFAYTHFPIMHLFDQNVLSYEVGFRKPSIEIYEYALKKAGCLPSECFYTDDLSEYVEAARSLGIDAEVFTSTELFTTQLTQRGFLSKATLTGKTLHE